MVFQQHEVLADESDLSFVCVFCFVRCRRWRVDLSRLDSFTNLTHLSSAIASSLTFSVSENHAMDDESELSHIQSGITNTSHFPLLSFDAPKTTMIQRRLVQETLRQRLLSRPRRWFAPQQHVWLQCAITAQSQWRVQWGLTADGMDRLGDVTHLASLVEPSLEVYNGQTSTTTVVQQGQDVLRVCWEGYEWTAADELYHTIWQSIEGTQVITSPVTGKVVHVVDSETTVVDEDIAWVEMECHEQDVLHAATRWVDEASYKRWIKTLVPSKFSDQVA